MKKESINSADARIEQLKQVLGKIQDLPTLSPIFQKITQILDRDQPSIEEVSRIVTRDPAITAKILRIANSPFYGFQSEISSTNKAISLLGFNEIKKIVYSLGVFRLLGNDRESSDMDRKKFWHLLAGCGSFASVLAEEMDLENPKSYFTHGLLHCTGVIALERHFPKLFQQILNVRDQKNCSLLQAEERVMDLTHCKLTGWLYEKWNFPSDLIEVGKYYPNPFEAEEHPRICSLINQANFFARCLNMGDLGDPNLPSFSIYAWENLGIQVEDLPDIFARADKRFEEAQEYIQTVNE